MVLLNLPGRYMEFISEFKPPMLMQSTSTVLVTGYSLLQIQAAASVKEIAKGVFWNHDQHLEVVLLIPPKAVELKGIQAVLGFPKLKIVKPIELGSCCMSVVLRQFVMNCLH